MILEEMQSEVHAWAESKGWVPDEVTTATVFEKLCLIHTEVSEAAEEARVTLPGFLQSVRYGPDGKPEGFGPEMADVVIRVMNLCSLLNIDLTQMIEMKHEYNRSRPYKHGGKIA